MLNRARSVPRQEREPNPGGSEHKGRAPIEGEIAARLVHAPVVTRGGNLSCMVYVFFAQEPPEVAVSSPGLTQDCNLGRELPWVPADPRCVFVRVQKDCQRL